jgi:nicotinate phosphoribosyltransferase
MSEQLIQLATEREHHLSEGIDFYKLTMGQIALEKFRETEVTFTYRNRDQQHPMSEYVSVDALQSRLGQIREKGFTAEEIAYFAGIQAADGTARFDEPYLDYLADVKLPDVSISLNDQSGELDISTTGDWAAVSLWETVIMSEANEEYFSKKLEAEGLTIDKVFAEGDKRLDEKVAILKNRPDIKIIDFGTRRRFSAQWQEHVIDRLTKEIPDNFLGTSNPWFAYKFGVKPIGSFAHEMPMVYAALYDAEGLNPLDGHAKMLEDWYERYGEDLSIALTDTFTSDFFFEDFTPEMAETWKGLRHDSGDPVQFGEKVINFYSNLGIDPQTKTIIFSDGLDLDTIVTLADHFKNRINLVFGWGTTLMNDMGIKAKNVVMKATHANGVDTVKLSDSVGKHTGPVDLVERYQTLKDRRLCKESVAA